MEEPLLGGKAGRAGDREIPVLGPGNTNCGGCGMSLALQFFRRAAGKRDLQFVIPACCGLVASGSYPQSAYGVPVMGSTFPAASSVASGMARVARLNGEATRVVAWAGDGGTYDIGFASLSAAAERNEDLLYVCYDNEIYGNTGGQRSSATPQGATTTNLAGGKPEPKKDILAILAAHRIPYAASVSLAHPEDMVRKFRRGLDEKGFRFLHVLSPCPTGWKSDPALGVELVRLAVRSGLYPILESEFGGPFRVNVEPDFSVEALTRYLALQRRFRASGLDAGALMADVAAHWKRLRQG